MYSINDLKIGTKIIYQNQPYQVIFCQHAKLGRSGAILRTKIRNLISGTVIEKTFAGKESIEEAQLEIKKAQFLYQDNQDFYFMDLSNFDQFTLNAKQLGKTAVFLKEEAEVDILYFQNQPINLQLSPKISLKVKYTEPGFRGNTSSATTKPATLENNLQINVPLFIKEGDTIIVDTRTGEYVERAQG